MGRHDLSPIGYPLDNMATVLAMVTPAERLDQIDRANTRIFDRHLANRHYVDAYEFLAGWLTSTEHTRRRIQGPGPDPATVVGEFAAAVVRQVELHRSLTGGVNATGPAVLPSRSGAKDSNLTAPRPGATVEPHTANAHSPGVATAPESCAPGDTTPPRLVPVPGDPCGHVSGVTGMVCVSDQHPTNPRGHYYIAGNGSDVADRHCASEAVES